ncbi:MAG: hypothetical protein K8I27_01135 [Planctomycetes bacterium]|nr:hypothetical protein [Planctomycetota bacterium]
MRVAFAYLLLLLLATPLVAQDNNPDEQKPVDLAVAFPSTTMVYLRADTSDYFESLNPEEIFAGLEGQFDLPDLGNIARDRLELELSDEEVSALAKGVEGTALGLLDVAVSGPKFQVVFQHRDLSSLARALKDAEKEGAMTVPGVDDYYGTLIYEVYLPLLPTESRDDFAPDMNPFSSLMTIQDLWISVFKDKYLVIATSENAVKDAVDYISFPEDPIDTLLGNARYKEAIAPFDAPQSVFFVNVQAVINTMERLAGDKGSSGPMQEMLLYMLGVNDEQVRFFFNLVQYEQFKSFAAGFWLDETALTLRMDANLVFHNPPGWFDTLRVKPQPMPFTSFIPGDAMFAMTDCVQDVGGMYDRIKAFFTERANAAGQPELVKAWDDLEASIKDENCSLKDTLDQLGVGQAGVVLPGKQGGSGNASVAAILGLKNRKQAEDFFFSRFIDSVLGKPFKQAEGEITPITIVNGVEIHHDQDNELAFAFMDFEGDTGVLLLGELDAVRRIVLARTGNMNLHAMKSWQAANGLLWGEGSLHMYINFGSMLETMGGLTSRAWMWESEDDQGIDRDDTEKDEDPTPFLANFFRQTVLIGSARSNESSVNVRFAAAGWPSREEMRGMALHFRDVERNRQIRDDFVRVRDAARAYYAIKGAPAAKVAQLLGTGLLVNEEWSIDPFGADDETPREYAIAEVPEDVDIRQPILCAYQAKPGLRGNHLAVLWNGHIVALTPEALTNALALAKEGKPLPRDGDWYRDALRPLYEMDDPRTTPSYDRWVEEDKVEVVIIDDEGNEQEVKLDQEGLMETTEEILDQQKTDEE